MPQGPHSCPDQAELGLKEPQPGRLERARGLGARGAPVHLLLTPPRPPKNILASGTAPGRLARKRSLSPSYRGKQAQSREPSQPVTKPGSPRLHRSPAGEGPSPVARLPVPAGAPPHPHLDPQEREDRSAARRPAPPGGANAPSLFPRRRLEVRGPAGGGAGPAARHVAAAPGGHPAPVRQQRALLRRRRAAPRAPGRRRRGGRGGRGRGGRRRAGGPR